MIGKKYALITGGSSGVGFSIAKQFAKLSYSLLLVGNRDEENRKAKEVLKEEFHVEVCYLTMDLATPDAAQQLYNYCENEKIEVEVLVNNAGFFFFDAITNGNTARTEQMLHLHITTPTLLCALFGEKMKENRKGYILNISSICAHMPYPGVTIYGASKRYIKNFSISLASELSDFGIKVTTILPGAVDTDLYNLSDKTRKKLRKWKLLASPDKIAKKAIKALFKGKIVTVPYVINRLILFIIFPIPHKFINFIKRKLKLKPFIAE
ncbi:MAG TPA: SDR family NAD(P)-dependent oxidoreductase [Bacteroidales bacterium]|jgi:hypothetical protein|nr:SDR family NAD(P)-dependent oxidoreductase [Bacteroidales bacterium]